MVLSAVGLVLVRSLVLARFGAALDPYLAALAVGPILFLGVPWLALRAAGDDPVPALRLVRLAPSQAFWLGVVALAIVPPVWALGVWNTQLIPPPEEFVAFLEHIVPHGTGRWILALITAGLVVPVCEEVVFRGLVQQASRRMIGGTAAALTTGALFALLHGQPWMLAGLILIGCVLGLVYEATGSLWAPILVHGVYNTAVIGIQALADRRPSPDPWISPAGAFLAVASAAVAWMAYARLRPARRWDYLDEDPMPRP